MVHKQCTTGTCEHPFRSTGDSFSKITNNYTEPAVPLTVVSLGCPPGSFLSWPDKVMCNEQGEWEPDPRKLSCNALEDFSAGGNF